MDSRKCQTATVTPAEPGDYLFYLAFLVAQDTRYLVPALPLMLGDATDGAPTAEGSDEATSRVVSTAAASDPIELLFVRVNSAGEPLAGEELTYSLLKAAWPDAARFIDRLEHKPAKPSRIAMLCVRLILARQQVSGQGKTLYRKPLKRI